MNKLWLTLMTQDRLKDIDELTKNTYQFFDGIVAVDHFSKDGTFELLESRKGKGKILQRSFVNHHAHSMNEFLFAGVIKNLDWFLILDSPERINLSWLTKLREDIAFFEKNHVGAVFLDRIYLARYVDSMEFFGGVHWGLRPFLDQAINFSTINGYRKSNYIINTRDNDRLKSAVINPAKYFYCYGSDSQLELLYRQFGDAVFQHHQRIRLDFRLFCQYDLGLDFTLDSLINYLKNNVDKYPKFFEEVMELEVNLKDLFRLYVLNHTLEDLSSNRFNFSYFLWKEKGIISQKINDGYIGAFNKYRLSQGKEME